MANNVKEIDIEEIGKHLDEVIHRTFEQPTLEEAHNYWWIINEIITTKKDILDIKREFGSYKKNSFIYAAYKLLKDENQEIFSEEEHSILRDRLKIKRVKSHSGIVSITIFTSAYPIYFKDGKLHVQSFSCKWDCAYCPNEPGQPRSYLKGEPGVMRANRNDFNCVDQMHDRMCALYNNGHDVDKLEVLVLGGTWESYPIEYRDEFIRDMYYSANVFQDGCINPREKKTLEEERDLNRNANCKVIGLTLETRPDTIKPSEIVLLRSYGCTRVQLGIQHIDNNILRGINRGCLTQDAINAIKMLKDCGFKIDAHWMPNLPGATKELDDWMFNDQLLAVKSKIYNKDTSDEKWDLVCPDLQVDQWKIYPCTIVPYTKIEGWYRDGSYIPYSRKSLTNLLLKTKSLVFPWIRLNRVVRDIPTSYSLNPDYDSNLRNDLIDILHKDGLRCKCIRCREVKENEFCDDYRIIEREYNASDGIEIFIEANHGDHIYGFLRLRYSLNNTCVFQELQGCLMIRELHVYGQVASTTKNSSSNMQHKGIGKKLIARAEEITQSRFNYWKIAVIAGEGTRNYYQKLGFCDTYGSGRHMIKVLKR